MANFFELPGVEQHSFTLKALEDATQLRNHVIGLLERADSEPDEVERRRQLTFVVAGGGFAGTETIAELCDLVHSVMRFYPNIAAKDPRFVLIHSRDRILPELSAGLGEYALRKLEARGIEFLLNARVIEATADAVLINRDSPDQTDFPGYSSLWVALNYNQQSQGRQIRSVAVRPPRTGDGAADGVAAQESWSRPGFSRSNRFP